MKRKNVYIVAAGASALACAFFPRPAHAFSNTLHHDVVFSNNGALTASSLAAVIASTQLYLQMQTHTHQEGNTVKGSVYNGSFGVIGINQNTGANANNQQSIAVTIGEVDFPPQQP